MNSASQWRVDLLRPVAALYAENPQVATVILGGSAARGHADRYSDGEVGVFWHQAPTDNDRASVVEQAGADLIRLYDFDPEEQVWSDDFMVGRDASGAERSGLLVEVAHYTVASFEETLNRVLVQHQPDELAQSLISGVVDCIPVYGDSLIQGWQAQATPYPRELAVAVVNRYGVIDHFWRWRMFLERGENLPLLYQSYASLQQRLLHVLIALNRVYYFGFKWIEVVDARLTLKPEDFLSRFREVFGVPPEQGARILTALVNETFDLVEVHLPEVDVARLRRIFHYQRPVLDEPPTR